MKKRSSLPLLFVLLSVPIILCAGLLTVSRGYQVTAQKPAIEDSLTLASIRAMYSVPVGAFPLTGAYDSSNRLLFMDDSQFPGMTAINGTNWAYTFPVCTGSLTYAQDSIYDSQNNELYVACYGGSNYVAVVDPSADVVIATIAVPDPQVLAFDPSNLDIYVGNA